MGAVPGRGISLYIDIGLPYVSVPFPRAGIILAAGLPVVRGRGLSGRAGPGWPLAGIPAACRVAGDGEAPSAASRVSARARVRRAASGRPSRIWMAMMSW